MTREMIMDELKNRGYEVQSTDAIKNGVLFQGIIIGNGTLRPTVYVNSYLDRNDLNKIVDEIEDIYDRSLVETPTFNANKLMDWDYAKNNLQLCLQRKGNEDIIKRDFLDLEQYVRVIVDSNENGTASFKVKPEHLEKFGISEDVLFDTVMKSMKKDIVVEDMLDILAQMMPDMDITELKAMSQESPSQIVITNKKKLNGASSICDMETLSKIADKHNADLAILPSSINECILIPVDESMNFLLLDAMIQDINRTEVPPEEVLGEHAYRFIRDEKRISYYVSPLRK